MYPDRAGDVARCAARDVDEATVTSHDIVRSGQASRRHARASAVCQPRSIAYGSMARAST